MKAFVAFRHWARPVAVVEVDQLTDTRVVIKGRKQSRKNRNRVYCASWQEAWREQMLMMTWAVDEKRFEIKRLQRQVETAQGEERYLRKVWEWVSTLDSEEKEQQAWEDADRKLREHAFAARKRIEELRAGLEKGAVDASQGS